VHLQVQGAGYPEENFPLQLFAGFQEEVRGPVQMLHCHLRQARDDRLAGHPVLDLQRYGTVVLLSDRVRGQP